MEFIIDKIKNISEDICAEVIINEIIQNTDLTSESFVINYNGQFNRSYRYDILNSRVIDFNLDSSQNIEVSLSRDGIYDMLPQGFTHIPENRRWEFYSKGMLDESVLLKEEENEARLFFQPFENEIFSHRLEVENMERKFLFDLNGKNVLDFFYNFWGISKDFPKTLISKFIRLLPYAYKIVGNIELATESLSYLLDEEINHNIIGYKEFETNNEYITLGDDCELGNNFVCGSSYIDYSLYLEIQIGPLNNTHLLEYLHEDALDRFLTLYCEHFFPMEIQIERTLLLKKKEEQFNLQQVSVLGYSTRI